MEQRMMGRSGLNVPAAGIGCNTFGWWIEADDARKVVDAAIGAGATLFDTADMYDDGRSETFLGEALGKRRGDVTIVSKFGMAWSDGDPNLNRGSRRYIVESCEASLRRLKTDWIDLYLHHAPDPKTPVEETLDALDRLVDEGKIRYFGCSNYAGWQIADADWTARNRHLNRFVAAENEWNLLSRGAEAEVVPACERFGLGVLPYYPIANGLLTGKYRRGETPADGTRLADRDDYGDYLADAMFDRVEALDGWARDHGHSLLELALCWLASHPVVGSVIAGATKPEQVEANAAALAEWRLTADEMVEIDALLANPV